MKLHTDVTTLSQLFPLFKEAGIHGVLTGDLSQIKDLNLPDLAAALLQTGSLPQICAIITHSETLIDDDNKELPWEECSLLQCLGVLIPFVIDITVGPVELNQAVAQMQAQSTPAISS